MSHRNRLVPLLIALIYTCVLNGQETTDTERLWQPIEKPEETDETSRKLMDLNLKARGGVEALQAVESVRFSGRLFEGKSDYQYTVLHEAPASIRVERYRYHIGKHYTTLWASDGKEAWTLVAQPEKGLPANVNGLEQQLLDFQARLPFLFLDADGQGHRFSYLGKQKYAGREAYLMHGWLSSGFEFEVHLDAESFQVINFRIPYQIAGEVFLVDHTPSRMRRADGVLWVVGWQTHIRKKTFRRIEYEEIETNVEIPEDAFRKPPVKEFWLKRV